MNARTGRIRVSYAGVSQAGGSHSGTGRARRCAAAASSLLRRGAFTLTELLVVIVIIVLILAIAVPSFTAIIYSQESSLAQTRLATAIRGARDAALQASGGADTAAVFFFEPGGRTRIITCIKAGELEDSTGSSSGAGSMVNMREIFVPLQTLEPTELPRNWMVRGYAPTFSIPGASGAWYEANGGARYPNDRPSWVFPETGFFDLGSLSDGSNRQTFMIRFQAGSGMMAPASASEVLVLSPRKSADGRNTSPAMLWQRPDRASDYRRFVRQILADPRADLARRRQILGDISSDTVLARPVWMLALYDEKKLAATLGATIDRATGCLYRGPETGGDDNEPRYITVQGIAGSVEMGRRISEWIDGDTNNDDEVADRAGGDQPESRIFTIDRFTGDIKLVEVEL